MSTSPAAATWGHDFDPDRLARLELRMWKAYYRRQPVRLMTLLIQANHEQAGVSWPRAVAAAFVLARAAAGFGRSDGDYDRFLPDIVRGYRMLGLPETVDARGRRAARAALVGRPAGDRARGRGGGGRRHRGPVRRALPRAQGDRGRGGPAARARGRGPGPRRRGRSGRAHGTRARATGPRSRGCFATPTGACRRRSAADGRDRPTIRPPAQPRGRRRTTTRS